MTLYDTFTDDEKDNFNNNLGTMSEIIDHGNKAGWDVYESLEVWSKRYFAQSHERHY